MAKYRPPLFNFGTSSMASVFGIEVYGGDEWWRFHLIRPIYNVGNRVHRWIWKARYRLQKKHRYHLVDTGLKPGYYDADYLMLHSCFSLLCRYVEGEQGGVERLEEWSATLAAEPDKHAPEASQRQSSKDAEAAVLYRWWKEKRPADLKRRGELLHHLFSERRTGPMFVKDESSGLMKFQSPKWSESDLVLRKEMNDLDDTIQREEQEMLHRLIDIRGGLWT